MSQHQLEITIRGAQGSGKSRLASAVMRAAGELGFGADLKIEGMFAGGTMPRSPDIPRILIEEVQTDGEAPSHHRWREHSIARHTAVLLLLVLAIMAVALATLGML